MVDKSWQMAGGPGNPLYELYDGLRRGLNRQLTNRLATLALHERGIVIEAGSGTGVATLLLSEHPNAQLAVAVDNDIEALYEGRRFAPELCAVVADINHLPFKTGSAQLVWNSSTIEHLPDQAQVTAEMGRVSRAYLFIGVPYKWGPLFFQRFVAQTGLGIWLGTVFDRRDIEGWLSAAGFRPLREWRYFWWFFIGIFARREG